MSDPTIRDMLLSRRQSVTSRIRQAEAELEALRAEDTDVVTAMRALGMNPDGEIAPGEPTSGVPIKDWRRRPKPRDRINEPTATVPMKVLIVKALMEEQFSYGSSARNIQNYIETHWGRKTTNSSMNAELNLLKKMGEIKYENQLWRLALKRGDGEVIQK